MPLPLVPDPHGKPFSHAGIEVGARDMDEQELAEVGGGKGQLCGCSLSVGFVHQSEGAEGAGSHRALFVGRSSSMGFVCQGDVMAPHTCGSTS